MLIPINRICFFMISVSLFCEYGRDHKVDTTESTDLAAREELDDESVLNFDSSDTLPEVSLGEQFGKSLP